MTVWHIVGAVALIALGFLIGWYLIGAGRRAEGIGVVTAEVYEVCVKFNGHIVLYAHFDQLKSWLDRYGVKVLDVEVEGRKVKITPYGDDENPKPMAWGKPVEHSDNADR